MVKISLVTASTAASTLKRWRPEGEAIKRRSKHQTLDRLFFYKLKSAQFIIEKEPIFVLRKERVIKSRMPNEG